MHSKWNNKINQVTENTLVVGMDIAKRIHYTCFVDERRFSRRLHTLGTI